ncbi:MAG: hypothetical protein BRC22_02320 [Parcubacteria group bacterium QH_9_35_7]|nr:MAG: hypothetical protein BRC22_02320 [Parcubacteria group bacterium QH_9_35_7]
MSTPQKNEKKSSIKDIFLHLLSIITLYGSVFAVLTILFQVINIYIPDPAKQYFNLEEAKEAIRFSVSVLIVMFPVYIWTLWFSDKKEKSKEWNKSPRTRSLLRSFTLFLAGLILIGSLISTINYFLNGELTTRFLLKILAIFTVIGSVFGYYLKSDSNEK